MSLRNVMVEASAVSCPLLCPQQTPTSMEILHPLYPKISSTASRRITFERISWWKHQQSVLHCSVLSNPCKHGNTTFCPRISAFLNYLLEDYLWERVIFCDIPQAGKLEGTQNNGTNGMSWAYCVLVTPNSTVVATIESLVPLKQMWKVDNLWFLKNVIQNLINKVIWDPFGTSHKLYILDLTGMISSSCAMSSSVGDNIRPQMSVLHVLDLYDLVSPPMPLSRPIQHLLILSLNVFDIPERL